MAVKSAWRLNIVIFRRALKPQKYGSRLYVSGWGLLRLNRFLNELSEVMMPRGKQQSVRQNGYGDIWFAQVRLTEDQKKQFHGWVSQGEEETSTELAVFLSEGMKTSITWDSDNACFIVSSTCRDDESVNFNGCLTSRSNDWYEGMLLNVFKAHVLLAGKEWPKQRDVDNWG